MTADRKGLMTTGEHKLTLNMDDPHTMLEELERACDSDPHWHAIRVSPSGEIHLSTEDGPCYSEAEHYRRMPYTVTVVSKYGHGQCALPSDWFDDDGYLLDAMDECVEVLEKAGYVVEKVSKIT